MSAQKMEPFMDAEVPECTIAVFQKVGRDNAICICHYESPGNNLWTNNSFTMADANM